MSMNAYFNACSWRIVFLQKRSVFLCLIAMAWYLFSYMSWFFINSNIQNDSYVTIWTNIRMKLVSFLLHIGIFITGMQCLVLSCLKVFLLLKFVILYTSSTSFVVNGAMNWRFVWLFSLISVFHLSSIFYTFF